MYEDSFFSKTKKLNNLSLTMIYNIPILRRFHLVGLSLPQRTSEKSVLLGNTY